MAFPVAWRADTAFVVEDLGICVPAASAPQPAYRPIQRSAGQATLSFHFMEQPIEAIWSCGPAPLRAIATIAS